MSIMILTEPDTPLNDADHVGSFNLYGSEKMELKKHQVPMTIDEQVENLKELGLVINDEEAVKEFLNDVSYFRLIKAYSIGLKKKNDNYNQGVTFDMIKELYLFNCNFRQALFAQIEKVEINLRCRIANHFSYKYGNFGYEDAANFENEDYHSHFLAEINSEVDRNSKSAFVKNFRNNYETDKIPMYALIELFSFGTLSKFYKNMKQEDKKAVAQIYDVKYTYLESWIEHIAFVRNICAHYGRLYNMNLSKTPALYKQYTKQGISSVRVFATLVCLSNILPRDRHWNDFIDLIETLLDKYPNVKMELMGFPTNWKDVLI